MPHIHWLLQAKTMLLTRSEEPSDHMVAVDLKTGSRAELMSDKNRIPTVQWGVLLN